MSLTIGYDSRNVQLSQSYEESLIRSRAVGQISPKLTSCELDLHRTTTDY